MTYCNLIDVPYIGSKNFPIYQSSTCSWFSAEMADHRYQVWHINQDPILDRHSLVVVPGPKSKIFHVWYGRWLKNLQFSAVTGSQGPRDLKFGIQASNILYFHGQWSKSMDLNFFISPVKDTWSLSRYCLPLISRLIMKRYIHNIMYVGIYYWVLSPGL